MEVTVIAEAEEIKFQALAFHHLLVGQITDADLGKVRLSRNRTQACELRTIETYPVIILRMLVS